MSTIPSTGAASDAYATINGASGASATQATNKTENPEDRFLRLLVTQLKNQDPLNPLDNAQMTSQLAQMSTVSGIEKLNATLSSLVDDLASTQSMQAAGMIGKSVLVPGSQLVLADGQAFGGVNLTRGADLVTVKILDANGNVIQSQDLGGRDAGVFNIAWDGATETGEPAADGTYTFTVSANQGGAPVEVTSLQVGTVSALVRSNGGFLLDLGALGTMSFDDVQQIL
ncbi:MAG: flagellar hook assembly protein FlgD [Propionivibrio sp.]